MTAAGKAAFLDAIKQGNGFIGLHSATDTFHTGETADTDTNRPRTWRYHNPGAEADRHYVRMIGAEFIIHSVQQVAQTRVTDQEFPGFEKCGASISLMDEWYSLTDFSKDLHVLLVQETEGMTGIPYQRPPYPATWVARKHGQGRVFYTSHGAIRGDVWTKPRLPGYSFQGVAGLWEMWTLKSPPTSKPSPPNAGNCLPSRRRSPAIRKNTRRTRKP